MKNYKVIEDNGGGLTLVVFAQDGEKIEYIHSDYEYNPGQLSKDLEALKNGADPVKEWEGNDLHCDLEMENPTDLESWFPWKDYRMGWKTIADNEGIYPEDMGGAGSDEFLRDEKGRVKFQTLQAMGYEDGKALLELLGYEDGGPGMSDGIYCDYIHDQYFILYDNEGEEVDVISWTSWENGKDGEDSEAEVVKEGWTK